MKLRPGPTVFRAWCRKARKLWPLDRPVKIKRLRRLTASCLTCEKEGYNPKCEECKGKRRYVIAGDCYESEDETHYVIRIRASMCKSAVQDTLLHEWAHLLRGEYERDDEGAHDDAFWTLHGELYRCWHERGGKPQ